MYHFPHAFRHATFCPCPGGDIPNSKRYFDAIFAGCIPLILSQDFVWPYSSAIPGSRAIVQESDFSIRLNTTDFWPTDEEDFATPIGKGCLDSSVEIQTDERRRRRRRRRTMEEFIMSIPESEIRRLQSNLPKAASVYSYFTRSSSLPDHPLLVRTLPDGAAARALVQALEDRRYGKRWSACQEEIRQNDPSQDNVHVFRC